MNKNKIFAKQVLTIFLVFIQIFLPLVTAFLPYIKILAENTDNTSVMSSPAPLSRGIPTLNYNGSDPVIFNSVTGVWKEVNGGTNVVGLNQNEIRWGTAADKNDASKVSGLRFDGTGLQSVNTESTFLLGELKHINWLILNPSPSSAKLRLKFSFQKPNQKDIELDYNFLIDESANLEGKCQSYQISDIPCDDRITFVRSEFNRSQIFKVGDIYYTLEIVGFIKTYPGGVPVNQFITVEQTENSAYLIGKLTSTMPQLELVEKAVNGDDADSEPGIFVEAGTTANFTYKVKNTGSAYLTNIKVIDDKGVVVTCPKTSLDVNESMICTGSATAVKGQYKNTAHAEGTYKYENGSTTINIPVISNEESANYYNNVYNNIVIIKDAYPVNVNGAKFNFNLKGNALNSNFTLMGSPDETQNKKVFNNIHPGRYSVTEFAHEDWRNTEATCKSSFDHKESPSNINLNVGETVTCTFKNVQLATLKVVKTLINDDGGTAKISDFYYQVKDNKNNIVIPKKQFSADGVSTNKLMPQADTEYTVEEIDIRKGYEVSYSADCSGVSLTNHGEVKTCQITNNDVAGKVKVINFNDVNGDGILSKGDPREVPLKLQGLTFKLESDTSNIVEHTDSNGEVMFNNVPIDYYKLNKPEMPNGLVYTGMYCVSDNATGRNVISVEDVNREVTKGLDITCYVGSQIPVLHISKTNDTYPDPIHAGESVYFNIEVSIPETYFGYTPADLQDIQVRDLFSDGFTYIDGTGSIGGRKVDYDSASGIWYVGNLKAGQKTNITYGTITNKGMDDGIYVDMAWASAKGGNKKNETSVIALNTKDNTYFVGTEVEIVSERKGEVLGVVIETTKIKLPRTGGSAEVIFSLLVSIILGLGMAISGFIKEHKVKMAKAIAVIATLVVGFTSFIIPVEAASTLKVGIEKPKSLVNSGNFAITFVAMDITEAEGNMTVDCYKRHESESAFTQFETLTLTRAMGNTASCTITDTLTSIDGKYDFYVKVNKSNQNSATSNTVSVTVERLKPQTPVMYKRTKLNNCSNNISFKTADDGRTSKVVIYRSQSRTFNADATTRVGEVTIAPNTLGSYIDNIISCNTSEYYYVIQAMDRVGNVSGVTGDKHMEVSYIETTSGTRIPVTVNSSAAQVTITVETTISPTKIVTVTPTAMPTLQVTANKTVEGSIGDGAFIENSNTNKSTKSNQELVLSPGDKVLGQTEERNDNTNLIILILTIQTIVIIGGVIYIAANKKSSK